MIDASPPWADSGSLRAPTAQELALGFQCGPADPALFNYLLRQLFGEIGHVVDQAGITPNGGDLTQLYQALQAKGLRAATTALTGVVELATDAEAVAGVDSTRALTPTNLLAALGAGGTGASADYFKIPIRDRTSGIRRELIVNYGSTTVNQTGTITLPAAYPTAHLFAVAGGGSAVDATVTDSVFIETSTTSLTTLWVKLIRAEGSLGSRAVRWLSIGV